MELSRLRSLKARLLAASAAVTIILVGGSYSAWNVLPAESSCRSCHEIGPAYNTWISSAHRNLVCADCHGTATSSGLHSLREKSRMVLVHFFGEPPEKVRLKEEQVLEVMDRCILCHRGEHADWLRSGHSATYASIFLNQKHNHEEKLYPDCLKCHGMFFDGTIGDLVEPLNTKGPWRLKQIAQAKRPVIPCLACHELHSRGEPAASPDYASPQTITATRREAPSPLVWYDRYSDLRLRSEHIVLPPLYDGERVVAISDDHRQRVCTQCHAPNPFSQAGTSDDRTPKGVHEGLSCLACHGAHSQETGKSCGGCHPALSNCGLDVTRMDTTSRDRGSSHNIHFVKCADCHPKGIPRSRIKASTLPGRKPRSVSPR